MSDSNYYQHHRCGEKNCRGQCKYECPAGQSEAGDKVVVVRRLEGAGTVASGIHCYAFKTATDYQTPSIGIGSLCRKGRQEHNLNNVAVEEEYNITVGLCLPYMVEFELQVYDLYSV